ncbi:MAG: tyrosine-type recombinase/integrase [Bacillota bacterium]
MDNRYKKLLNKSNVRNLNGVRSNSFELDLFERINLFLTAKRLEGLSPLTLEGYKLELNTFANKLNKNTHQITTQDIRLYLGEFNHLKMSSLGRKLSVLKSFFQWLTEEELILRNPTLKVKQPKTEQLLPKALSIAELEMLREACTTIRQRAFLEILYVTGCRLSEVHALNISDIDIQGMSTNVLGKGNKEREVYLSYKAIHYLNKYISSRDDECEALIVTERKPYRRLSKRGIQREINVIANNAGLGGKVSPNVLRHTFATLTLNNGAEIVAVQELLGHSSSQTTLRYARLSEERKRDQHKRYLIQ